MNRNELLKVMNASIANVLRQKNIVCFVDVLMDMGKLKKSDYEDWRFNRVPFLERVIQVNLASLNFLLRSYATYCKKIGLSPSWTAYMRWGKGPKQKLRFSKSGDHNLEMAYATHYLTKKKVKENKLAAPMPAKPETAKDEAVVVSRGKSRKRKDDTEASEQRTPDAWEWELLDYGQNWAVDHYEPNAVSTASKGPEKDDTLPF